MVFLKMNPHYGICFGMLPTKKLTFFLVDRHPKQWSKSAPQATHSFLLDSPQVKVAEIE